MRLDHAPFGSQRQLRTAAACCSTPREGKLQRSSAGQAIQSLLWGLGEQRKINPASYRIKGEALFVEHPNHGRIAAWVLNAGMVQASTAEASARPPPVSGFMWSCWLSGECQRSASAWEAISAPGDWRQWPPRPGPCAAAPRPARTPSRPRRGLLPRSAAPEPAIARRAP
jgi:hypothetical protein